MIVLPERATFEHAEAFVTQLRAVGPDAPLNFDASKVETLATPIVLAIVSAVNSRSGVQPPAIVTNPSSAFVDAFTDLGLFQDLMKMEFAS